LLGGRVRFRILRSHIKDHVMTTRNVAVFVGSPRKQSLNRKIANETVALAPSSLRSTSWTAFAAWTEKNRQS
jgi:hypothetical protein